MIIGLGNPGPKYSNTRHNVGYYMIELLREQLVLSFKKPFFRNYEYARDRSGENTLHFVKPLSYMNRSGEVLPSLLRRMKVDRQRVIIITDNMDLPVGRVRMKAGGSSAGHNGIKSVIAHLEGGDFYRLYIGVGRPAPGISVVEHVLGQFGEEEHKLLTDTVQRCVSIFSTLHKNSPDQVMNEINTGNS